MIEEILIYGTLSGGIYALLAVGFALIYGVAGIVNLAHGSFYMIGSYIFSVLTYNLLEQTGIQLNPFLALLLALGITAVISSITYRLTIHPILGDEVGIMVATICLALIFQQLILLVFGAQHVPVRPFVEGTISFLGRTIPLTRILAFGVSILLFTSLWIFIRKTRVGNAMRAVSLDREAALLMGVNTEKMYMLTMALSAMLAAVAGVSITGSTEGAAASWMWLHPLALSFSIVILGGLGSIKGSLVGGFVLGWAENIVTNLHTEAFAILSVVPFTVMVIVLVLKPKGLFGKRIEMEE